MTTPPTATPRLSRLRVGGLRGAYALLAFALGATIWPQLLDAQRTWSASGAVVASMLGALSALAFVGLWRPLRMLPLLFFEIVWKAIFLARMALPPWRHGTLDAATTETAFECLFVVIVIALVPWSWVARTYGRRSAVRSSSAG